MSKIKIGSRINPWYCGEQDANTRDVHNETGEVIKGYIGQVDDQVYYTDGKDVYRANKHNVVDCTTGYLIGRWECSIAHWKQYKDAIYSMIKDCREYEADLAITKYGETSDQCTCGAKEHEHKIPSIKWPKFGQDWR